MATQSITEILGRVKAGERINYEEAALLYRNAGLAELGEAATARRFQLNPRHEITYLVDRNINYTNKCITDCGFCNFYALPNDNQKGYVNDRSVIGHKIMETIALGGTRILMQGGHNPELPYSYYVDLVTWIKRTYPSIDINAFSPSEIQFMAEIGNKDWRTVLSELKQAGMSGLPGGGGEILDDEIRKRVSPKKIMTDDWFGVMKVAHELQLVTTATMVIGFREEHRHRLNHMFRLRAEQDDSLKRFGNGFNTFISWPVQIKDTPLGRSRFANEYGATNEEAIRHTAMSRIILDNIPHITSSWPTLGLDCGTELLRYYGADDFGGTMIEENVVSSAGAPSKAKPAVEPYEFHQIIRKLGMIPVQRNSAYQIVRRYDDPEADKTLPRLSEILSSHLPNVAIVE